MAEIIMRRTAHGLQAWDDEGSAALRKIPIGTGVRVTITRPRSVRHHRLLWALLKKCIEAGADYPSEDSLLAALKIRSGHCDIVRLPSGQRHAQARSISFTALDQAAFNKVFDTFVKIIVAEILPGVTEDELRNEVLAMIEPSGGGA
jgi:Protein of unknown function (DUF1367)